MKRFLLAVGFLALASSAQAQCANGRCYAPGRAPATAVYRPHVESYKLQQYSASCASGQCATATTQTYTATPRRGFQPFRSFGRALFGGCR